MTTDGYVEHIVKTKTSAGIMVLIVLGAFITVVGAFFMFFVPGGAIFGLPLAVVGVIQSTGIMSIRQIPVLKRLISLQRIRTQRILFILLS